MEEKNSNPIKVVLYISVWVIIWGTLGSFVDYPLYKNKIYIEGRIKTRKWKAEDGADRYSTEINVNEFTFLNTKKDSTKLSSPGIDQSSNFDTRLGEPDELPT